MERDAALRAWHCTLLKPESSSSSSAWDWWDYPTFMLRLLQRPDFKSGVQSRNCVGKKPAICRTRRWSTKYEHGRGEFALNLERHMENMSFLALVPNIRILQEQRQFACKRMRHAWEAIRRRKRMRKLREKYPPILLLHMYIRVRVRTWSRVSSFLAVSRSLRSPQSLSISSRCHQFCSHGNGARRGEECG